LCPPADPDAPGINAGFTLIEALVTLAVIAISLAVIGSVVAANVRGTITVDQRISLLETARSLLTALPDRGDLTPGNTSGEMGGNRWRIDVLPFAADFVDPTQPTQWVPLDVVIRVEAPSGEKLRLDTVRLRAANGGQ
jgi:general secretion pathway protein I